LNYPTTALDFHKAFSGHGTAMQKVKYVSMLAATPGLEKKVKAAALKKLQDDEGTLVAELGGNHASLSDFHFSVARLAGIKKSHERVLLAAEHSARAGNWPKVYDIFREAGTPANAVKLLAAFRPKDAIVRATKFAREHHLSVKAVAAALEGHDDFARELLPRLDPITAALEHAKTHRFDAVVRLARDSGDPAKFAKKLLENGEPSAAHGAAKIFEAERNRIEAGKAYAIAAARHGMETRSAARDSLSKAVRLLKDDAESEALELIKEGQGHAGAMLFLQIYKDARRGAAALKAQGHMELAAWLEKPYKSPKKPPGNNL